MSYSKDLREKVMEYLESGYTQREARDTFGISLSAINKWHMLYITTGEITDKKRENKPKKLPPDKLKAYVHEHPDAYLQEIAQAFGCTDTAVSNALRKHGITRKKRRYATVSKTPSK
jgi:transposase